MARHNLHLSSQPQDVRSVYYTGTLPLMAGQPLCYQESAGGTTKGVGVDVEIPNGDNSAIFAGIVHPESVGVSSPRWIKIFVPHSGDILPVLVSNTAAITLGQKLKLNWELHTATSSAHQSGAFDGISPATVTAAADVIFGQAVSARAIAMGTLAISTGSGNLGRSLMTVQFL
jgi:hypothetical protein